MSSSGRVELVRPDFATSSCPWLACCRLPLWAIRIPTPKSALHSKLHTQGHFGSGVASTWRRLAMRARSTTGA